MSPDPQNDRSGGPPLSAECRGMLECYRAWRRLVEAVLGRHRNDPSEVNDDRADS
jgi:hypothetical protein